MGSHEMGNSVINAPTVSEQVVICLNPQVTLPTNRKEYCELMKNAVLYVAWSGFLVSRIRR